MTETGTPPRVLFVDDEPNLLNAISRQVRGFVTAELASSPLAAVELLERAASGGDEPFAAVVSDMRMPGMDGGAVLKHARATCPEATRMLLTGYTDITGAISAVNDGNIFRLLTKPCATPVLRAAIADAVEQYELVRDRRELLEQTLRGAVAALVETLAMAQPAAFARASRLRQLTHEVADRLGLPDAWRIEVAAQLGEIGVVTLPPEALDAFARGVPASPAVTGMLDALPDLADGVLRRIPRLEAVREIVRAQQPVDRVDPRRLAGADQAALVVQAVREYDALTARGTSPSAAIGALRERRYHAAEILDALREVVAGTAVEVREVPVAALCPGMVLAVDLRTSNGILLISHGHTLTEEMLVRVRNFASLSGLESEPMVYFHVG